MRRCRDATKAWASKGDGEAACVITSVGEQPQVDCGMAVPDFDAMSYAGQVSSIKASYERENKRRCGEAAATSRVTLTWSWRTA